MTETKQSTCGECGRYKEHDPIDGSVHVWGDCTAEKPIVSGASDFLGWASAFCCVSTADASRCPCFKPREDEVQP